MPDTTATGSLNKVPLTTEERTPDLGLLYFSCLLFFPLPVSVSFNLSHLLVPLFLPSVPPLLTLFLLHSQTLARCFFLRYLNVTEVKGAVIPLLLSPSLFLIAL